MAFNRKTKPKSSGRKRYVPRRKVCSFCTGKIKSIDYKDPSTLRYYISENGKIAPRHRTGTCARHQRALANAIKRARFLALLPYTPAHIYKTRWTASLSSQD